MRLAHSMADTLITPLNDSFVDFDVLGTVDPVTFAVTGTSHFAEMVREARRQRRVVDHATIDWIVVRNRLSMLGSRNKRLVGEGLQELSLRLGFRAVDGFAERVIFREFYPRGLTALDDLDEDTLGTRPEHVARHRAAGGRDAARHRSSCRSTSAACGAPRPGRSGSPRQAQPLELHDIIALAAWLRRLPPAFARPLRRAREGALIGRIRTARRRRWRKTALRRRPKPASSRPRPRRAPRSMRF